MDDLYSLEYKQKYKDAFKVQESVVVTNWNTRESRTIRLDDICG